MIKCESLGMLDVAKINPVITSENDVTNYDFITVDDILYLICNTATGDDAYKEDVTLSAGEYLNGYQVDAWAGKKLVIDGKHIPDTEYSELAVDNVLTVTDTGKLAVAGAAPDSGVYFVVTDTGVTLTEKAVKARVMVA